MPRIPLPDVGVVTDLDTNAVVIAALPCRLGWRHQGGANPGSGRAELVLLQALSWQAVELPIRASVLVTPHTGDVHLWNVTPGTQLLAVDSRGNERCRTADLVQADA